jgi:hypothetical protein
MKKLICSTKLLSFFLSLSIMAFISGDLKAQSSNIGVNGFFSVDKAQQGSTFQAAIVLDIPSGEFVNSNKPLGKYSVPTSIKIEAPQGLRVTPVSYPRANVRTFNFGGTSAERLAVFEGRTILRFTVTLIPNLELGETRIRVKVHYQSGSDKAFNSPRSIELVLPITVVTRQTPIKRVNGNLFGNKRG